MNKLAKQIQEQWKTHKNAYTNDIVLEAAEDLAAFFLETATDLAISEDDDMESDDQFADQDDIDVNL